MNKLRFFLYVNRHFINRFRFWLLLIGYIGLNLHIEVKTWVHFTFLAMVLYSVKYLKNKS